METVRKVQKDVICPWCWTVENRWINEDKSALACLSCKRLFEVDANGNTIDKDVINYAKYDYLTASPGESIGLGQGPGNVEFIQEPNAEDAYAAGERTRLPRNVQRHFGRVYKKFKKHFS